MSQTIKNLGSKNFAEIFFQKKTLLIIIAFQLIYAFISIGFYHIDEHFQILEFLNYKLGNTSADYLSWEFHAKIRPWMQICFYFVSYKFVHFFIPDINPFAMATIFRLESAFISIVAKIFFLYSLVKHLKPFVFKWTALILCFYWLFPYLASRLSSENFSSSFVLIALSTFLISIPKQTRFSFDKLFQNLNINSLNIFIIGCLFGLAFHD